MIHSQSKFSKSICKLTIIFFNISSYEANLVYFRSTTTTFISKSINLLQVEGLRKQLGKLDERARSKEQDLEDTLSKLEAFYKAYDSVMDDVQEVSLYRS